MPASPGCSVRSSASSWRARLVLRHDPVLDVGPVEAGHEAAGRPQLQPLGDLRRGWPSVAVAVSAIRGTSGQRSCSTESAQVVGPEVVAPLGDAVRLVDGEERDLPPVEQVAG